MATDEADAGLARPAAKKPKRITPLPAAPAPIAAAAPVAAAVASAEDGGAKRLSRRARQRQKHRARLMLGEAGAPANHANAAAARAPAAPQQKTPKGGIANADAAEATPKQKRAKRKAKRRAEAEAAAEAEAMDGGASERPPRVRISHSPEVPSLSQLTLAGDSPSHSPRRPLSPVTEDVARVERKEKGSKKSAAMRLQGAKFRMLNEKVRGRDRSLLAPRSAGRSF